MPESEAELWIGWGTHVFHDSNDGETRGNTLETYINEQFDRAEANPGEDFFSALGKATYEGRPLSREEKVASQISPLLVDAIRLFTLFPSLSPTLPNIQTPMRS